MKNENELNINRLKHYDYLDEKRKIDRITMRYRR